ncbi:hypothetical protein PghCCS26_22620 [Paenibacillus glycanilyticus]|uniref:Uncharacterized protein n=1 Tax=Paenibacillus glycanilyticus TaxID=126569 RepID=A0ABQ6NMA0_9BACL|nr:hypothetical protein [Paenibacillus glycanilyticus]GMK45134.1 hypothetical protein PghCCS26_22620 [Paenibacillus glycanilyticus]
MRAGIVLLFILLLTACGGKAQEKEIDADVEERMNHPKLVHKDDMFEFKLNIEKTSFAANEPLPYSASLTYVGEDDSFTVWGGHTIVGFIITDGLDFEMQGVNTTEMTTTKLLKGKTVDYPFFKSGGYDSDDPKADFWREFYSEKELILPPGNYLIEAICLFSLDEAVVNSHYNTSVYTMITVK